MTSRSSKRPVVVVGGGGHALSLIDALRVGNEKVIGILDAEKNKDFEVLGVPVLGDDRILVSFDRSEIFVVIGLGISRGLHYRQALGRDLQNKGFSIRGVIHPSATIGSGVSISHTAQILTGSIIQPAVTIEDGVVINTGCRVDHNSLIREHSFISPGATICGDVSVGREVLIGAGAVIAPGVNIGDGARVGAGAVVIRDISAGQTVVGNPGRPLHTEGE